VVALKEVRIKENITAKQYRDVINEVEVMKKIKHPNIIQLHDSFVDRQIDSASLKLLADGKSISTDVHAHQESDRHEDSFDTQQRRPK